MDVNQLMITLDDLVNQGVIIANKIKKNYKNEYMCVKEVQAAMFKFGKQVGLPELISGILKADPSKKRELQKIIMALTAEGKRVEDSLVR